MGKREAKIGKDFETDVQASLDSLGKRHRITSVRLYDSKAARNYLPEQPGDFIVASPVGGSLIECKCSEKHRSLASCLHDHVSTQQAAAHRLWARTGQPCWFLFYSHLTDTVEWWEGESVGLARATGEKLDPEEPLVVSKASLSDTLFCALTKLEDR